MKNRLVFRILGALSSALIVVSVFVPYVKVLNTTQSLWQEYFIKGSLYLPIMIIVFGAIGILLFSINIKTELVYSSVGALIFFLVMQTLTVINQNSFKNLSIGYYFLIAGTLITGIMAFICTMKVKVKEEKQEEILENSILTQIDKLYDNSTIPNDELENNGLDGIIQPIQVQDTSNIVNNVQPINQIESNVQPLNVESNILEMANEEQQPVVNSQSIIEEIKQEEPVLEISQPNLSVPQAPISIDNQPITQPQLQENIQPAVNPVTAQFDTPQQPVVESQPVIQNPQPEINKVENFNPVISQFGGEPVSAKPANQVGVESDVLTPLAATTLNNPVQEPKKSDLDIFG